MSLRAIVTTVPFGMIDETPLHILAESGVDLEMNPLGRRLKADEVAGIIAGFDVVIAGTETISAAAIAAASPRLKAICRVGIGLDGVDLAAARRHGVAVTYTPDAPSAAVAELTVGLMIDLIRGVGQADRDIRNGHWNRITGRRLSEMTVGIVGCGRIGSRVMTHLLGGFPGVRLLAHDVNAPMTGIDDGVRWVDLPELLQEADVVSLHIPLTAETRHMIGARHLATMKRDAVLVNTARGGIVDELALACALDDGVIAAAAIDVFGEEPYAGPLTRCKSALLTCHMGSMTRDCRARMEIEASQEAALLALGKPFRSPVPDAEYLLAESA